MNLAHFLNRAFSQDLTLNQTTMKKRFTSRQLIICSCLLVTYFLVIVVGILYADQLSVSL